MAEDMNHLAEMFDDAFPEEAKQRKANSAKAQVAEAHLQEQIRELSNKMDNEWKLYWVDEESEVYAARSQQEALNFVGHLTREKMSPELSGEVVLSPEAVLLDDGTGETVNALEEWQKAKAEGISEPFQFMTGYL